MIQSNDHELLRDFTASASESAFAQLVERHLPLVWSAACRQLRDPHLAQDVAQQVFTLLAQKAPTLGAGVILPGWLYRTTGHLAARTLRAELRRQHREQSAVTSMNECHTQPAWDEIAPLLDEAMTTLNERDRDAIVLRYFENKSLTEVGVALGTSDDAAQKRLTRAVEKLRAFFGRRGKSMTIGGFTALVGVGAIQPAPASLAATISAGALSGAVVSTSALTLSTLKIMSTIALKPIIGASAVLATLALIIVQHSQTERLRRENESLQGRIQKADTTSAELSERVKKLTREHETDPRIDELLRLRAEAARARGLETELARQRAEAARDQQSRLAKSDASPAENDVTRKFDEQRTFTVSALKQLGLQLRLLDRANNAPAAFSQDGGLSPNLIAKTHPGFDLKLVELLVTEPAQIGALLAGAPGTILARTRDPIPTPDGKWLRVYALADGSVQQRLHDSPEEAFDGNGKLVQVKAGP